MGRGRNGPVDQSKKKPKFNPSAEALPLLERGLKPGKPIKAFWSDEIAKVLEGMPPRLIVKFLLGE